VEPTEENRRAWDTLQRVREDMTRERRSIPEPARALLPDLAGKHVLHELCGSGEATAELAGLGALVTGIDVWGASIAAAREAHPHELPVNLRRRRFDVVYAAGLLPYLHDLADWIGECSAALREGGSLIVVDLHPAGACLDVTTLRWRDDYFGGTLVVGSRLRPTQTLRLWRLAEVVNAVIDGDFAVRRLEEFPTLTNVRRQDPRVPGGFALVAEKTGETTT
jgi:2-polyprenyl-3-methyl-5-hydroxy-6-metoxy-1,4-benzoquinol methylase